MVPEREHRYRLLQRAQHKHVRECLAQAVFYRVLEMERLHQTEIRRRLEDHARRERVQRIKVERSNRYEEAIMILSPRPPTGPKTSGHALHSGPDSSHSLKSSRPNTAPGTMQRPARLQPLNSNSCNSTKPRSSTQHRAQGPGPALLHSGLDRDVLTHFTLTDFSSSASPYRLPVINNLVTPAPPLNSRGQRGNGVLRGRRLRPTTTPSNTRVGGAQREVCVRMVYLGKSVHLSYELMETRDEVKVLQQHCGGENLCVYRGRLTEGESFEFVSRRHSGFPFSLTFYLNGLQVERLSSCCEFKHRKSSRLGGRHAHFGFSGVEGATPCYRCIIALGLDKKTPPTQRPREDGSRRREDKPRPSQETPGEPTPKNDYEEDFDPDDEGADVENVPPPPPGHEEPRENPDLGMNENSNPYSDAEHSEVRSSSSSSSSDEEEEGDEKQKTVESESHGSEREEHLLPLQDLSETTQGQEEVPPGAPDEQEKGQEKAKSVQEKLVDVILNSTEASSEPELSDSTSTEDEEPWRHQQQGAAPEGDMGGGASRDNSPEKHQPEPEEGEDPDIRSREEPEEERRGTPEPERLENLTVEEDRQQELEEPAEEPEAEGSFQNRVNAEDPQDPAVDEELHPEDPEETFVSSKLDEPGEPEEDLVTGGESASTTTGSVKIGAEEVDPEERSASDTPKDPELKDLNTEGEDVGDKNEKSAVEPEEAREESEYDRDGGLETVMKEGSEEPVEDQELEPEGTEEPENETKPDNQNTERTDPLEHESIGEPFLENKVDEKADEELKAEATAENQLECENKLNNKDSDPAGEPEMDGEADEEQTLEAGGEELKKQDLQIDENEKVSGEEQSEDSNPVLQEHVVSGAGGTSDTDPQNEDAHQKDGTKEEKEKTKATEHIENNGLKDEHEDPTPCKPEKDLSGGEELRDDDMEGNQTDENLNTENDLHQPETKDQCGPSEQNEEEVFQSPEIIQDLTDEERNPQGQEREDPEKDANQTPEGDMTSVEGPQEDPNAAEPDVEDSDQNKETQDRFTDEEHEQDLEIPQEEKQEDGDHEKDGEILQDLEIPQDEKQEDGDHEKEEDTDDVTKNEQDKLSEGFEDQRDGEDHDQTEIMSPEDDDDHQVNEALETVNMVEAKDDHQDAGDHQKEQELPQESEMESKAGTSNTKSGLTVEDAVAPGEHIERSIASAGINKADGTRSAPESGSTSVSKESQLKEPPSEHEKVRERAELIVAPRADYGDLVSNWVNVHQAAKYFQTFVEPLEEIKSPAEDPSTTPRTLETPGMEEKRSEEERGTEEPQELYVTNVMNTTPVVTFQISQDS